MIDIPCVILAGGRSSRMGEDKALLPFGPFSTLIEYQYKKLSSIFQNVYISSKIDKFDFLEDKNKIIYDTNSISSPMVALYDIFLKLENSSKYVFVLPVDTPFVKIETFEAICQNRKNYKIVIAQTKNKTHNLCGIFDTKLHNIIKKNLQENNHRINSLIQNTHTYYRDFDDNEQFMNLNTQKEYKNSLNIIYNYRTNKNDR